MLPAKGGVNINSILAVYKEAVGEVILYRYDQLFHETCVSSVNPMCVPDINVYINVYIYISII